MKKLFLFLIALIFITLSTTAQQQIIVGKNYTNPNEVTLITERGVSTTIKFDLNELNLTDVRTDYGTATKMTSAKAPVMLEAGVPELIYLPTAIIIPDVGSAELEITYGEYIEIENVEIAPSKGNLSRSIDPATVPYVKGEVYNQNAFFPGIPAMLNEPFIMRDVRGQTIFAYPVQYNPVTRVLRIYSEMTVTVNFNDNEGINEFTNQKRNKTLDPTFNDMYKNLFINHSSLSRAYPTEEVGEMLIICFPAFMDDMKPYVDWKRTIGRITTIVPTSTTGTTATQIKTYIQNYYNNPANNLAYVLLVGDSPQIPPHTASYNRSSDNLYAQLEGTDPYLEVLIGRFSAENVAQVQTQVQRSIHYERDLTTADSWLGVGVGLAYNEGSGGGHDGGEADYVHMNNIRNRMLIYGYNPVYQEYYGNCPGVTNTSASQISSRFNSGASIANYCNHGEITGWCFSNTCALSYNNTHVNQLQNAGKLPYIFSVACVNGKFTGYTCFAEAWMRATQNNQPTGAIATFMAWENLSWTPPMTAQDVFSNIIMDLPLTYSGTQPGIKRTIAGAMLNASQKMIMIHGINPSSSLNARSDYDTWIVFGDPTLMFRTKTPQAMAVTHNPEINTNTNSLSVTCVSGALAALTYIDGSNNVVILGSAVAGSNNTAVISFTLPATPPASVKLAVTGFNKVTYLANIPVSNPQPQLCEKPVELSGSASGNTATISWKAPVNIDGTLIGYNVYRDGGKIGQTLPTVKQYIDEGLANGTYIYQVSAKYEHCQESELTAGQIVVIFVPQFCEKPVELSGSASGNTATITWKAPVNIDGTLIGYNVYRDGGKIGETLPTVKQYTDEGLANGTYVYQVSAKYEHCPESELTAGETVVIFVPQLCEPPINIIVETFDCGATINWDEPENIDGILLGYNIYIDDSIHTSMLTATKITILCTPPPFLPFNVTYSIKINVVYEHCISVFTDDVPVEIVCGPQLCEKPVELSGINEENNAVLTWDEPANIDGKLLGYNVYRDEIIINEELVEEKEYRDEGLEDGTYIYKISAVYLHCEESELTEGVSVTIITDVINDLHARSVIIYPNPTSNEFKVQSSQFKVQRVEIFDAYGRNVTKLETQDPKPETIIDVSVLKSGVYFVKIYLEENQIAVKKLTIPH